MPAPLIPGRRLRIVPVGALIVPLAVALSGGALAQGAASAAAAQRIASIGGFETPESVRYDPDQDVHFVSNIVGNPSAKDGVAYISRISADGRVESLRFIEGGRDGVVLHAPKGMAIAGDTLWVADIDAVRGFDRRTGRALAVVELADWGATFLNDLALGADGALYVTDSGIAIDGEGKVTHPGIQRIFRLSGREASIAIEGEALAVPNGIAVDHRGDFLLAPIGSTAIQRWRRGGASPTALVEGPGGYDGIEVLPDGRVVVSSWADATVYELRDAALHPLIRNVNSPADIGIDVRRNRIAVPLFLENRVEIWAIGSGRN